MLGSLLFVLAMWRACRSAFVHRESLGASPAYRGRPLPNIANIGSDLMKIVSRSKEDDASNPRDLPTRVGDNAGRPRRPPSAGRGRDVCLRAGPLYV